MNHQLIAHPARPYLQCLPGWLLKSEQAAVDLIGLCGGYETESILIGMENLPEEFFDLRSGLAGAILGRFSVYRVRAAFVVPAERLSSGRFGEMVLELNRGNEIHFSADHGTAVQWITLDGDHKRS